MGRGAIGLFSGLAALGAVVGWVLGELILGRGRGPLVALVTAALGLLVAWALRLSRPAEQPPADESPVPSTRGPVVGRRSGAPARASSPRAGNVRVQKSRSVERKGGKLG